MVEASLVRFLVVPLGVAKVGWGRDVISSLVVVVSGVWSVGLVRVGIVVYESWCGGVWWGVW